MKYGIPSYHRPECKTINTLLKSGVKKEDIIVSVQDEMDLWKYKKRYPDINVIFRQTDCAAGNRNTLLDYIQDPMILFDDDITSFCIYNEKNFKKYFDIVKDLENLYQEAKFNKCSIFGVAANTNALLARRRNHYDFNCVLQGSIMGIIDTDLRFDESFKVIDDYELCCRAILLDKFTIRNNFISANKPQNTTNGGVQGKIRKRRIKKVYEVIGKKISFF